MLRKAHVRCGAGGKLKDNIKKLPIAIYPDSNLAQIRIIVSEGKKYLRIDTVSNVEHF